MTLRPLASVVKCTCAAACAKERPGTPGPPGPASLGLVGSRFSPRVSSTGAIVAPKERRRKLRRAAAPEGEHRGTLSAKVRGKPYNPKVARLVPRDQPCVFRDLRDPGAPTHPRTASGVTGIVT